MFFLTRVVGLVHACAHGPLFFSVVSVSRLLFTSSVVLIFVFVYSVGNIKTSSYLCYVLTREV